MLNFTPESNATIRRDGEVGSTPVSTGRQPVSSALPHSYGTVTATSRTRSRPTSPGDAAAFAESETGSRSSVEIIARMAPCSRM
jgi:hypothetical protein